jgi:hypothetical protein
MFFGLANQNHSLIFEQIELQAKLLNYFLGSNKSNINQTHETQSDFHGPLLTYLGGEPAGSAISASAG